MRFFSDEEIESVAKYAIQQKAERHMNTCSFYSEEIINGCMLILEIRRATKCLKWWRKSVLALQNKKSDLKEDITFLEQRIRELESK